MLNKGVFVVKIKESYESLTYYKKNQIPIKSWLVELSVQSKTNQKLRIKLRLPGKMIDKIRKQIIYNQYCIVEGTLSLVPCQTKEYGNVKKMLELNASKIYPCFFNKSK